MTDSAPPAMPPTSRLGLRQVETAIGAAVREMRARRGMTQGQLAEAIGVTYQQIHKYENGTNRISLSRLLCIAEAVEATGAECLQWVEEELVAQGRPPRPDGRVDSRTRLELYRRIEAIHDDAHLRSLLRVAAAIGAATGAPT